MYLRTIARGKLPEMLTTKYLREYQEKSYLGIAAKTTWDI